MARTACGTVQDRSTDGHHPSRQDSSIAVSGGHAELEKAMMAGAMVPSTGLWPVKVRKTQRKGQNRGQNQNETVRFEMDSNPN